MFLLMDATLRQAERTDEARVWTDIRDLDARSAVPPDTKLHRASCIGIDVEDGLVDVGGQGEEENGFDDGDGQGNEEQENKGSKKQEWGDKGEHDGQRLRDNAVCTILCCNRLFILREWGLHCMTSSLKIKVHEINKKDKT